jgi:hypothetical protein
MSMGSGVHAQTAGRGAAIFWQPGDGASGNFTISASFTQMEPARCVSSSTTPKCRHSHGPRSTLTAWRGCESLINSTCISTRSHSAGSCPSSGALVGARSHLELVSRWTCTDTL